MADTAFVSTKHRSFAVPFHEALASIVPGAKRASHPDKGELLVLPHTIDTTRLARNFNFRVPAPITFQYDWNGGTPFKTQRLTAAMLTMNRRAYVLSEMGTGKTRAALYAIDFLMREDEITKALIVAPLSTLSLVWGRETLIHFPYLSVGILHGTRDKRLKVLGGNHDIYVINHDGIKTILPELLARKDFDCVLIDELASFRNASTDRWRALAKLVSGKKFIWGMTGSPTPNEPLDAWAQCRLITPQQVPMFPGRFKREVMQQVSQFLWVPKPDAKDKVFEAMQPAVRFTRDECVELPPVSYTGRYVPLSPEQDRVFKQLMAKLRVSFQQGEVTAANEGVLFSKLLQIGAGYVYTTDRGIIDLNPLPRLKELQAVVEQATGKVIVFVDFVHAVQAVSSHLKGMQQGFLDTPRVATVTGETPKAMRDKIFGAFQNSEYPRIIVAHPKCMAHGLTLTAANTIVWYTPTTSLETYEQACARITRPGQTQKSLIIHLTGTKIEAKLYKRLQKKAKLQGSLLELFEKGDDE